jgi:hypothetical protein
MLTLNTNYGFHELFRFQWEKSNLIFVVEVMSVMVHVFLQDRNKYLRQPSIDFDVCNISSSCDVVYKGR